MKPVTLPVALELFFRSGTNRTGTTDTTLSSLLGIFHTYPGISDEVMTNNASVVDAICLDLEIRLAGAYAMQVAHHLAVGHQGMVQEALFKFIRTMNEAFAMSERLGIPLAVSKKEFEQSLETLRRQLD